MAEVRLKKEPHEQQQAAIDRDEKEQLYGGAKRGGKSVWLCQKSIMLNVMFPGNRGLLSRYNFTDLVDTTLTEFFEVCPSDLILNHHKGDRTIVLRTTDPRCSVKTTGTKDGYSPYASRQLYRGLGDLEDFEKVKGIALGHFEIDEPSEVPLDQYLMLLGQLDWVLPDGDRPPYMALLASNPEPGWVEDRFPITTPGISVDGKIFIPSLPADNPHLPPGYVDYLLKNFPKEWVMKYVKGIWGASEGAVFKSLDDGIHDLDNYITDLHWRDFCWPLKLYLAIDHGSTGTVAMVLLGINQWGDIFALHEYYEKDKVISEHCFGMREKIDPYLSFPTGHGANMGKRIEYYLIDPSATQKTQQRGQELQGVVDDYREHGFPCIPAWNALEHGLNLIAEHLHIIPTHRSPFTGHSGSPSLFISKSRCPNLWREIRGLKKKVRPNGYVEFIGSDHALDCLRYLVNSRPRRPELADIDKGRMSSTDLMTLRTHERWLAQFNKQAGNVGTIGSFGGMGLS